MIRDDARIIVTPTGVSLKEALTEEVVKKLSEDASNYMNDESIDVNLSFINTDYFSISVRDGYISVIGRITKVEMEKFVKAHYFEIKEVLNKNIKKGE